MSLNACLADANGKVGFRPTRRVVHAPARPVFPSEDS